MINDYDPSGKPFCIPCIPFRIPCFCVRWSRYDPFVVFFLDFLISMMIKIWNYISATLRIWEAICWMAEGGSKKRCYCPSRKRTRSAAKRFARGAPFVRFNTITWQSTFDPAMLSYWNLLYYCAWRCFAFKPDEPDLFLIGTDGGEVKYNWNHYRQPLWKHDELLYHMFMNCHGNTAQVYMATTKYASEYLMQYQGHTTPVNNVKFNPFVPVSRTFLRPLIKWGWERRFRPHLLQTNEKQMWYVFRFRQAPCY